MTRRPSSDLAATERVGSAGLLEGLFQEEYEIDCPKWGSAAFIAFGEYGTFASAGDHVTADPARTAMLPALSPLPARPGSGT
ncbi:hypothetical protein ABZV29_08960 [Streptomyces sp. NPDC005236]|uniref:hypothetical protein n=1 Tax=Streptomyces sp. NPDC005236 TaxID=3157028 RepID=UPI0033A3972B